MRTGAVTTVLTAGFVDSWPPKILKARLFHRHNLERMHGVKICHLISPCIVWQSHNSDFQNGYHGRCNVWIRNSYICTTSSGWVILATQQSLLHWANNYVPHTNRAGWAYRIQFYHTLYINHSKEVLQVYGSAKDTATYVHTLHWHIYHLSMIFLSHLE